MTPDGYGNARLTWDQVREIRQRYNDEEITITALAAEYRTVHSNLSSILDNRSWHDPEYTPAPGPRYLRGSRIGTAVLDWPQVKEIRKRYTAGEGSTRILGAEYGVSAMTISKIVRGIFWPDPDYTPPDTTGWGRAAAQARNSDLTWGAVNRIRQRYAAGGETYRSLAREYGVTPAAIGLIVHNGSWVDDAYTPPSG